MHFFSPNRARLFIIVTRVPPDGILWMWKALTAGRNGASRGAARPVLKRKNGPLLRVASK
ncbi:hypothetical protein A6M21_06095 [Desulfotomaculum copahuensis]|uniref:Uncharacterized protein n=1 Tax=Desulfotomaculum copahuensis TaxID=1838280 RepID=A0A1B7LH07_9FIRM|nr:hypothetical protein A6M21_06095 [Desulfotomaculum copahuensis]